MIGIHKILKKLRCLLRSFSNFQHKEVKPSWLLQHGHIKTLIKFHQIPTSETKETTSFKWKWAIPSIKHTSLLQSSTNEDIPNTFLSKINCWEHKSVIFLGFLQTKSKHRTDRWEGIMWNREIPMKEGKLKNC